MILRALHNIAVAMVLTLLSAMVLCSSHAQAAEYMSLAKDEARMRYGPSTDHPIKWVYQQKGWPFEVRARFDQWAKVRDINGEEGWIHRSLLSTRDFALIQANNERNYVILRKKKNPESAGVVRLEDDSLVRVHECSELYCKVGIAGYRGFLEKKVLWGVAQDK